MSFSYDFSLVQDTVQFAYCIPYTYSKLNKFLTTLTNFKQLTPLKSLSGLAIPVLSITDQDEPEFNKQAVLVTARMHPGQSNSSFVAQGMLEYLCGAEGKELRKNYIFYVVPMMNPDGVAAGNYRTSLFGKDLNRTFNQSRKYAFPETFHLVQLARQLKVLHKKRFSMYIDLHGHSVKKNAFMYGPDFGIQHINYDLSRQLPHLLGSVTSMFRYYSCIFRISNQKTSTARAIFNRKIDIAFTYTMESSNGFYYDSANKMEMPFTARKYKQMGVYLCKAFGLLTFDANCRIKKVSVQSIVKDDYHPEQQKISDDQISEGKSDSEPEDEDFTQQELELIEKSIEGRLQQSIKSEKYVDSPTKSMILHKLDSKQLKDKKEKISVFLPPINTLNRAVIFSNRNKMKEALRRQRMRNVESQAEAPSQKRKIRYSISQIVPDYKEREYHRNGKDRSLNLIGRPKILK